MNQTEYEEMFIENENAPADAPTSTEAQNQKVPEQNQFTTDQNVKKHIYLGLSDVAFSAILHPRFYDIAWHLEQIRQILEGEK